MSLRNYLIFMVSGTLLCWGAWLLVIFFIDPSNAGVIGLISFYATLLFSLTGSFFLVSFAIRRFFNKSVIVARQVGVSFRQAVALAVVFLGALWLQSRDLLNWVNIILLILILTILEIFFVSLRRQRLIN